MARKKKSKESANVIATNRKASYEYNLEDRYEAGIVLDGWEVKSMRENRANLKESHITAKGGELFLVGAHVSPGKTTSTHVAVNPTRNRKLLLHRLEINRLIGAVERKGYTLIPTQLYWSNGKVKLAFALARGKKQYDKRASIKARDIEREQARESSNLG
ncbi:MAG: SsrA-binding protein SmpB [Acidiferrobacterales bacterium]|nr:SsrA-binding protein SmpB [Acidiferrobacterales bacterium]